MRSYKIIIGDSRSIPEVAGNSVDLMAGTNEGDDVDAHARTY